MCTSLRVLPFHPLIGYDMSCDNIEYFIENHAQTHENVTKEKYKIDDPLHKMYTRKLIYFHFRLKPALHTALYTTIICTLFIQKRKYQNVYERMKELDCYTWPNRKHY